MHHRDMPLKVGLSVSITMLLALAFYLGGVEARLSANEKAISQTEKLTELVSELSGRVAELSVQIEVLKENGNLRRNR